MTEQPVYASMTDEQPEMTEQPAYVSMTDEQPGSPSELESSSVAEGPIQVWEPGVWVRLPWLGLGSLLTVLLRQFFSCSSLGIKNQSPLVESLG